jgi:hypothetical protein
MRAPAKPLRENSVRAALRILARVRSPRWRGVLDLIMPQRRRVCLGPSRRRSVGIRSSMVGTSRSLQAREPERVL